jgi:hypothetical protein
VELPPPLSTASSWLSGWMWLGMGLFCPSPLSVACFVLMREVVRMNLVPQHPLYQKVGAKTTLMASDSVMVSSPLPPSLHVTYVASAPACDLWIWVASCCLTVQNRGLNMLLMSDLLSE